MDFLKFYFFKYRRNKYINRLYQQQSDPWSSKLTYELISEKMKTLLGEKKFNSCLDVGCGEGVYSRFFKERCGFYLGVDISKQALKRAASLHQKHLEFKRMDFDQLSSLDKKFDLIVFNFVLDYLGFQDYPQRFTSDLFNFLQGCAADQATLLIMNPIYKPETWDRLQKYRFLLERFGFFTLHCELVPESEFQVAFLVMTKTK